jgi:hypothetical protein
LALPDSTGPEGLAALGILGQLSTHEERVAKARTFFKEAGPDAADEIALTFIKSAAGWRADFGLPERAAQLREREQNLACVNSEVEQADLALRKGQFTAANELIQRVEACKEAYLASDGAAVLLPDELDARIKQMMTFVAARKVPVKWELTTNTNPIDEVTTAILHLEAEEETHRSYRSFRSVLRLRCKSGKPEVFFTTDGPVQSIHGDWDHSRVRLRLDDAPARTLRASESTGGSALFLPGPQEFIEELRPAKRLLIGWTPHGSGEVATEFDVHGVDEHLDAFRTACGWTRGSVARE